MVKSKCLNQTCVFRSIEFLQRPTFNEKKVPEELKAINSEFEKYFDNDDIKADLVDRQTCDQKHNHSMFFLGNTNTLKTNPEKDNICVRDALIEFHKRYYVASAMRMVIYANQTIDTMTKWVVDDLKIKEMPKVDHVQEVYKYHYFRKDQNHLAKFIYIVPIRFVLTFLFHLFCLRS